MDTAVGSTIPRNGGTSAGLRAFPGDRPGVLFAGAFDFPYARRVIRAAYFALVGIVFFAHWIVTDPTYEGAKHMQDWPYVLWFSGTLLLLAFAVPLYARLVGGLTVFRTSLVPAAGAALASLSNILEDGLRMDGAFFVFVLGTAALLLGLLVLTAVIAVGGRGTHRLLALVPAGTMAAVLFYVLAGGVLMLITWLAAAGLALALPRRTATQAPPTP